MRHSRRPRIHCQLLVVFLTCAAGCRQDSTPLQDNHDNAYTKTFQKGPVKVEFRISPLRFSLGDDIFLQLQVEAQKEWIVACDQETAKIGEFHVVTHSREEREDDNVRITIFRYRLEPFLIEDYTIPPLRITFHQADADHPHRGEIETEAVALQKITPATPSPTLDNLRPMTDPVALRRRFPWFVVTCIIISLILIALLARRLITRKVQKARLSPPTRSPYEIAVASLQDLLRKQLIDKGHPELFIEGLSDIIRLYIEDQFGIHAPEQTTEEFLQHILGSGNVEDAHKHLLEKFLTRADLVKFARHIPEKEETEFCLLSAKNFLEETRYHLSSTPNQESMVS